MPVSAPNSMSELLTKMLRTLTDAKLTDDADPDFLDHLEQVIVGYLRAPADQALAQQQQGGMVPPAMGGAPPPSFGPAPDEQGLGGQGGQMTVGPAAGWPAGRGSRVVPTAPNPDQINQILRQTQGL